MVEVGAALPFAPGAYSVIAPPLKLLTQRLPDELTVIPSVGPSPVFDPAIVRFGLTFPFAPAAKTSTCEAPSFAV